MSVHIKNLKVHGYRGIRSLTLNNLADINILTGDNNSGKTSVLEIINTIQAPLSLDIWSDCIRKSSRATLRTAYYESFLSLFPIDMNKKEIHYEANMQEGVFYDNHLKADFYHSVISEEEMDKVNGVIQGRRSKDQHQDRQVSSMELTAVSNNRESKIAEIYDFQYRLPRQQRKIKEDNDFKCIMMESYAHTNGKIRLSQILSDYEIKRNIIEALREYDADIIDIIEAPGEDLYIVPDYQIITKTQTKGLPLSAYGDGMKKALSLMSEVLRARDGVLLLDEFETAIHTSAMQHTFEWILETGLKNNVQFFLTSHSKEAIDAVLHSKPEIQSKINLYTLYKYDDKTIAREMTCEEAMNASQNLGLDLR